MLIIREAQMEMFQQTALEAFAADLIHHLQTTLPGAAASLPGDAEQSAFVKRAIAKGAEYGIDSKSGITLLAELMLQFGESFERSPLRQWTTNILTAPNVPGHIKAETLRQRYQDLTGGRPVVTVG